MKTASYWFGHLQQISKWRVPCREERKNAVASERRPRYCLHMGDISCAHIILNTGLQSLEAVNINIKLSVTPSVFSFLLTLLTPHPTCTLSFLGRVVSFFTSFICLSLYCTSCESGLDIFILYSSSPPPPTTITLPCVLLPPLSGPAPFIK